MEKENLFLVTFQDHFLCHHHTTSLAIPQNMLFPNPIDSAQFKEEDSHALTLGNYFQGTSEVSQVVIIPFADCWVAIIHQSPIILSYL